MIKCTNLSCAVKDCIYGRHGDSMPFYAVLTVLVNGSVAVNLFLHDHISCMPYKCNLAADSISHPVDFVVALSYLTDFC